MRRREFITGASASTVMAATAGRATASTLGRREFRILRDGDDIGRHSLTASRDAAGLAIEIAIDIRVKVLGITAYRYTLENREVWAGRRMVSLRSETDDDGDRDFASIEAAGELLEIDGSGYSGTAPRDAVSTSYYTTAFLERRPWVSSQSGLPLDISIAEAGGPRRWQISGELETRLIYDAEGEWVGCEFDAGGAPGNYELIDASGAIGALWQAS